MTSKNRSIGLVAVGLTMVVAVTLARAQDPNTPSDPGASATTITILKDSPPVTAPGSGSPAQPSAGSAGALAATPQQKSDVKALHDPDLQQKVKDVLTTLTPERKRLDHEYQEAASLFPSFCKDWEQKLHDRETNNVEHIIWKLENGFETALYTGYGPVESCETHQSAQGFSIGKLSYEEFHYLIKAKSLDEAKHTKGTQVDDTHCTEIFRWEKGKWFY